MILDVSEKFYLKMLTCIVASEVNIGEHNDLTLAAGNILSYEFPKDIKTDLDDMVFIIKSLNKRRTNHSEIFMKSFARKDPDLFKKLASDQTLPRKFRIYKLSDDLRHKVIFIAKLYNIKYEQADIKDLF